MSERPIDFAPPVYVPAPPSPTVMPDLMVSDVPSRSFKNRMLALHPGIRYGAVFAAGVLLTAGAMHGGKASPVFGAEQGKFRAIAACPAHMEVIQLDDPITTATNTATGAMIETINFICVNGDNKSHALTRLDPAQLGTGIKMNQSKSQQELYDIGFVYQYHDQAPEVVIDTETSRAGVAQAIQIKSVGTSIEMSRLDITRHS